MTLLLSLAVAVLCQVLAVVCLWLVWKQKIKLVAAFNSLGILLWLLSFGFWISAIGNEFGMALAFFQLPLLVWLLIYITKEPAKNPSVKSEARTKAGHKKPSQATPVITQTLKFINGIVLTGTVTVLGLSWFVASLPMSEAGRLILALILLPLVWGTIMAYAFATQRQWRLLAVLGAVFAIVSIRAVI